MDEDGVVDVGEFGVGPGTHRRTVVETAASRDVRSRSRGEPMHDVAEGTTADGAEPRHGIPQDGVESVGFPGVTGSIEGCGRDRLNGEEELLNGEENALATASESRRRVAGD